MKRIGVDVGGTFTDLILIDEDSSQTTVDKVPSTPDDPARGVVEGIHKLCQTAGVTLSEVTNLLHGTTVATNIVLTHTGAEVGMITTEGFRDILHIARHKKPFNFSLQQELPWQTRPLIKRRHRLTVSERVTAPAGEILVELDEDEVRDRIRALREAGVQAISVCLLHSYLNPDHERRIKEIALEEYPEAYLSVSHEVLPLYREFERFSTVSLNAYVGPKVSSYVARFDGAMEDAGFRHGTQLMQSSGGMTTVEAATQRPVNLLMSGPVAGLLGGIWAGKMSGYEDVVTLDIGGTSADIGVAAHGQLRMRHLLDTKVGDYQAMVPMVDIDTIGAGGGSIAYVDEGGIFRVGPQSAGADPGPACYGHGGTEPTSTDAQLLLGRLRPDRGLLGGDMSLSVDLAEQAMSGLADQLGISVRDAALGALQLQKFGMTQSIELNSVRRGYDPRDFTLVAAGGAGPLFACDIAMELDIPRVLIPPHPGIIAATGLLTTDIQHEFVATERHSLRELDKVRLHKRFAELSAQAIAQLERDSVPEDRRLVRRLADCRYAGQGYEVRFDVPAGAIDDAWVEQLHEAFHQAHEAEYGHRFDAAVEVVNIRVVGVGRVDPPRRSELAASDGDPSRAVTIQREVVFDVGGRADAHTTPFYDREQLRAGDRIAGPAIIEQYDSTTVVPPGLEATVDRFGNLVIDCTQQSAAELEQTAGLATPILMRVIGGAFSAIAKEMAGVLYRMSYSSIIRESEDLGAGHLRLRRQRAGRVGLDPDVHGGDAEDRQGRHLRARRRHPRRRHHPPQRPLPRSDALARRGDRGPGLPGRRARRLRRRLGAPARHRGGVSRDRDRPDRQLVGGQHLPGGQARRPGGMAGGPVAAHPGEHPHRHPQPRRHPGDDLRVRARQAAPARAPAALRPRRRPRRRPGLAVLLGAHAPPGDRQGARRRVRHRRGVARRRREEPWRQAPGEGAGDDRRRRAHRRPHRLQRRGPDRVQLPVRGHDRVGDVVHRPHDLPRRGRLPGVRAPERGHAETGQRDRAEGLDLQPQLPPGVLRPLLSGATRRRPRPQGALRRRARRRSPLATLPTSPSSPTPGSTSRPGSTGSTWRSTRGPTAGDRRGTGWTPSTA